MIIVPGEPSEYSTFNKINDAIPELLIPKRKPVNKVTLANTPLTKNLVYSSVFNGFQDDVVTNTPPQVGLSTPLPSYIITEKGKAIDMSGSNLQQYSSQVSPKIVDSSISLYILLYIRDSTGSLISHWDNNFQPGGLAIKYFDLQISSGNLYFSAGSGGFTLLDTGLTTNQWYSIGISATNSGASGVAEYYSDGIRQFSGTHDGNVPSNSGFIPIAIARRWNNYSNKVVANALECDVVCASVWYGKYLTAAEHKLLHDNPYEIYKERNKIFPLAPLDLDTFKIPEERPKSLTKPIEAMQVNRQNHLGKQITRFFLLNSRNPNCLVTKEPWETTGSFTEQAGNYSFTGAVASNYAAIPYFPTNPPNTDAVHDFTFGLKYFVESSGSQTSIMQISNIVSSGAPFLYLSKTATDDIRMYFDGVFTTLTNAAVDEWNTVNVVGHSNDDFEIYSNGKLILSNTSTQWSFLATDMKIWLHNGVFAGDLRTDFEYCFITGDTDYTVPKPNAAFTAAQIKSLYEDPYQVLEPISKKVFFGENISGFPMPDSRVEAPSLFLPKRKPVVPVTIDWDNPIARKDLMFAYLPQKETAERNLVNHQKGVQVGTQLSLEPKVNNMALTGATGAGNYISYTSIPEYDLPEDMSVFALVRHTDAAGFQNHTIVAKGFSGGVVPFVLNMDTAQAYKGFSFYNGAWRSSGLNTSILNDYKVHAVCGTYDQSDLRVYIDGVQDSSSTYSRPSATTNTAPIAVGSYTNDGHWWEGDTYCVYIFREALSPSEVRSLSSNPYQIFIPE